MILSIVMVIVLWVAAFAAGYFTRSPTVINENMVKWPRELEPRVIYGNLEFPIVEKTCNLITVYDPMGLLVNAKEVDLVLVHENMEVTSYVKENDFGLASFLVWRKMG